METTTTSAQTTTGRSTILGLVKALTGDVKTFVQQEIRLAKTELSEKLSQTGRNAASLAIGGFVAYAGLIVLLIGIGLIIAYAFEQSGMTPFMAGFVGLGIMGFVVAAIGGLLVMKALKGFSNTSLSPERTIHTLHELRQEGQTETATEHWHQQKEKDEENEPSSAEVQAQVEATEARMGDTLNLLGHRLSPRQINMELKNRVSAKPYKSGLIAMALGLVSGLWIKSKFRKAPQGA